MRWRVFAFVNRKWKFLDSFDSKRDANDLLQSYRDAGYKAFATLTSGDRRRIKRNPAPSALAQAQRLYRKFTGKTPPAARKIQIPSFTKAGVVFGTLFGVGYLSERDGKAYQHTFRKKSRPSLIASTDGKTVLIVGGRFAFTERGIVDK